jgi:CRISPR type III-B/RAMP module RAMP protein Cmr6
MPDSEMIKGVHQRWLATTEGAARFTMTTRSRLIIGLGGKGALEFGITLHPVTGLPYIPGSALKGLCRNYTLLKIAEKRGVSPLPPPDQPNGDTKIPSELEKLDEELCDEANSSEDAKTYREMFGIQGEAGHCIFFDAVMSPLKADQAIFELDVMTPHFSEYYRSQGGISPHDADSPIPVTFITVSAGIEFSFAVKARKGAEASVLSNAVARLQSALSELGIGSKTAAGYGLFYLLKPIKDGIEVGDEIAGKVFENSNGIWFEPDEEFTGNRNYEAQIPPEFVKKQRGEGERVKARVVEIRKGDPIHLICEQIVDDKRSKKK